MKILVVGDDKALRHSLKASLEAAGFTACCTEYGAEALTLEANGGFDAAVLDIGLPDIDGFEVLSALRRRGSTTPVLMLTARDGLTERVAGLDPPPSNWRRGCGPSHAVDRDEPQRPS